MALGINFQYLWIKLNICIKIKFIHVDKNKSVTRRNLTLETSKCFPPPSPQFSPFCIVSFVPIVRIVTSDKATASGRRDGVCHTSIGVRIDTFAECETEVAFGAMY